VKNIKIVNKTLSPRNKYIDINGINFKKMIKNNIKVNYEFENNNINSL